MFVERDTGPKNYFEVPLARAYQIFRDAYQQVSRPRPHGARPVDVGDARQGPGGRRADDRRREGLRARRSCRRATRSGSAGRSSPSSAAAPTWFDQLVPALGEDHFFFEGVRERTPEEQRLLALPVAS